MSRILGVAVLFALVSCATGPYKPYAREVKKKPGVEGTISLKPDHVPEDRAYADTLMARNCGNGSVNVTEESEVAVGSTTTSNAQAHNEKETTGYNFKGFKFVNPNEKDVAHQSVSSTSTAIKEWHINYVCKSEVAKPAAATSSKRPASVRKK
ncbi:MAG TPA: hypothetical protein VNJ01_08355 [Bacteriovoracaceae bacterium]|nr:hypothetical protein [Bacteriovoracaceae bacterium]